MGKRVLACLAALALLLGATALGEPLRYESPENGMAFDLPQDWIVEPGEGSLFYALDESGWAVLLPGGRQVSPEEDFFPEIQKEALDFLGVESEDALQTLFFAQARGQDGKWYALASFGCMLEETPNILNFYHFTRPDGALGGLVALSVNNEKGAVTRNWLDGVVLSHLPEQVMAEMLEQVGP